MEENETTMSFRRGWQEAMEGKGRPVSELWEGISTSELSQ